WRPRDASDLDRARHEGTRLAVGKNDPELGTTRAARLLPGFARHVERVGDRTTGRVDGDRCREAKACDVERRESLEAAFLDLCLRPERRVEQGESAREARDANEEDTTRKRPPSETKSKRASGHAVPFSVDRDSGCRKARAEKRWNDGDAHRTGARAARGARSDRSEHAAGRESFQYPFSALARHKRRESIAAARRARRGQVPGRLLECRGRRRGQGQGAGAGAGAGAEAEAGA